MGNMKNLERERERERTWYWKNVELKEKEKWIENGNWWLSTVWLFGNETAVVGWE